eukprot:TRINITY_DN2477_c0_g1_i2.p1 TRINITY_DN2477_c0_g1~~TRINITY_DN2477_c0_g1_i2.p1  ORF type:complete len:441 (+),score=104.17 TRINITY_DN2477_c0_g1_i2:204-1526(+)
MLHKSPHSSRTASSPHLHKGPHSGRTASQTLKQTKILHKSPHSSRTASSPHLHKGPHSGRTASQTLKQTKILHKSPHSSTKADQDVAQESTQQPDSQQSTLTQEATQRPDSQPDTKADQDVAQESTQQPDSQQSTLTQEATQRPDSQPDTKADQDAAQECTQQPDSQQAQPGQPQQETQTDMQALIAAFASTAQQELAPPMCVEILSIQNPDDEAIKITMTTKSKVKDLRVAVKEVMGFDDGALRQLRLLKKKGNCYLTLSDDDPVRQKVYLHHPDILKGGISPQPFIAKKQSGTQQEQLQQQAQPRHVKHLKHTLPVGVDSAVLDFTQLMFEKMNDEEREAWNDLPRHVIWIMWFDMLGSPLFVKCADQQFRESVFGANFEKKAPITLAKSDPVLKEYAFHKRKLISVWFSETGPDVAQEKRNNENLLFDFDELDELIS